MPAVIEFRDISKSFDDNAILTSFNLSIPENVTTALVGESGSGKSTLLMLANGLLKADAGSISILGADLEAHDLVRLRRQLGYAVQGGGLFPHLTVAQNVSLMAELEGWDVDEIDQRTTELFELLNLDEDFATRFPHSLSGGQQQRVSLCRAMMLRPPLLLLDEPFSALDPLTRDDIHAEFIKLQSIEPRSILLVTHDMQEAAKLAQHVVILQNGQVVQEGSVETVIGQPANDYVRRLLRGMKA